MSVNPLPTFPLSHPGAMLAEMLEAAELGPAEAARRLGVSRQLLHTILSGRTGISADMALRLARLLGGSPQFWTNLQANYSMQQALKHDGAAISRIEPLVA